MRPNASEQPLRMPTQRIADYQSEESRGAHRATARHLRQGQEGGFQASSEERMVLGGTYASAIPVQLPNERMFARFEETYTPRRISERHLRQTQGGKGSQGEGRREEGGPLALLHTPRRVTERDLKQNQGKGSQREGRREEGESLALLTEGGGAGALPMVEGLSVSRIALASRLLGILDDLTRLAGFRLKANSGVTAVRGRKADRGTTAVSGRKVSAGEAVRTSRAHEEVGGMSHGRKGERVQEENALLRIR